MKTLLVVAVVSLLVSSTAFPQSARVTRTKRGDTTVVLTTGNGPGGPVHDAVELLRVNADTKESTFGSVYVLTATPDGGVVIYDTKSLDGPIIRQFDANGKFVRNLGRRGSGPGEYEVGPRTMNSLSMTAQTNGSVVVRESSRAVLRYGPDGWFRDGFMLYHTNGSTNEIVAANDGTYWVRAQFGRFPPGTGGAPPGLLPMVHYDGSGKILDSLVHGPGWAAANVDPNVAREWWTPIPDGRVMFTRTDKVGFLLTGPKRASAPLIAEVVTEPVRYSDEERKELEGLEDFRQTMPGGPRPRKTIPATKPPSRGASVDINGRIWVARPGPGVKLAPRVVASFGGREGNGSFSASYQDQIIYTGFRPDGTLLGEVRFPAGARVTFVGNTAWAIIAGEDDVPVLVKYKLFNACAECG